VTSVEYATVRCPECGQKTRVPMPVMLCQYFFSCPHCQTLLKPKPGDCCVFCSYSDRVCPPRAEELPGEEHTVWTGRSHGGFLELRLYRSVALGWSIELFLNGRFLASHRCDSEARAREFAAEMQQSWSAAPGSE
jgi:hypothetical protein